MSTKNGKTTGNPVFTMRMPAIIRRAIERLAKVEDKPVSRIVMDAIEEKLARAKR